MSLTKIFEGALAAALGTGLVAVIIYFGSEMLPNAKHVTAHISWIEQNSPYFSDRHFFHNDPKSDVSETPKLIDDRKKYHDTLSSINLSDIAAKFSPYQRATVFSLNITNRTVFKIYRLEVIATNGTILIESNGRPHVFKNGYNIDELDPGDSVNLTIYLGGLYSANPADTIKILQNDESVSLIQKTTTSNFGWYSKLVTEYEALMFISILLIFFLTIFFIIIAIVRYFIKDKIAFEAKYTEVPKLIKYQKILDHVHKNDPDKAKLIVRKDEPSS